MGLGLGLGLGVGLGLGLGREVLLPPALGVLEEAPLGAHLLRVGAGVRARGWG